MTSTATPKRQRLPVFDGILPIDTARIPSEAIAGATLAAYTRQTPPGADPAAT